MFNHKNIKDGGGVNLRKYLPIFTSAFIIVAMLFTGCSSQPEDSSGDAFLQVTENPDVITEITPSSIASYIITFYDSSQMTPISAGQLSKHYNIPNSEDIQFAAYISTSGTSSDEFAVFKVDGEESHDTILNAVIDRVNQKSVSFRDAKTIESKKIQNSQIVDTEGYIILIVHDNAAGIKDSVTAILTGN